MLQNCKPTFKTIFLCFCLVVTACDSGPPNDAEAVKQFNRHRAAYELAIEMFQQDPKVNYITANGVATNTSPEVTNSHGITGLDPSYNEKMGLTRQRYADYMETLHKTGAIDMGRGRDEIDFLTGHVGFASNGWGTRVVYRVVPPINQISSFD